MSGVGETQCLFGGDGSNMCRTGALVSDPGTSPQRGDQSDHLREEKAGAELSRGGWTGRITPGLCYNAVLTANISLFPPSNKCLIFKKSYLSQLKLTAGCQTFP